jgi:hypothetical protein
LGNNAVFGVIALILYAQIIRETTMAIKSSLGMREEGHGLIEFDLKNRWKSSEKRLIFIKTQIKKRN